MISPEKIPVFTGDLGELGREIIALLQAAKAIREHGGDVHTRFQHLGASYQAPEEGQLFATTQAVQETSGRVADRLEAVAGALETYATEVVEIVRQLDMLRWQATVFVQSVKDQDGPLGNWRKDEAKVAEHQGIWDGVNAAVAAFQKAEVTCADKITVLVDGTQWHINDGSPKQQNPYGFSADQLGEAESLPWGKPEHHEILPFGIDYHIQQVGISVWDNAAGSVEGLIDLFSPGEEGGAAREGLAKVIIGAEGYLLDPHGDREDMSPFMQKLMNDSKPHAKEFGKAFVGWDDWSTNPGKAFGTVIFNGITLGAGPLGAASKAGSAAGKAGAASRVAGAAAKIGEVLDPIGAAAKTVGLAARTLPKVADLTAGVRAATTASAATDATHSFIEFPNGSQLRVTDGQFIPGRQGMPDTTPAPREPAATDRTPSIETPRRHELVGAGARTPEGAGHAGENPPPQANHETTPGGRSGSSNGNGRDVPRGGTASAYGEGSGASPSDTGSAPTGASGADNGSPRGADPLGREPHSGGASGDGPGGLDSDGSGGSDAAARHEPEHGRDPDDRDGQEPNEGHEESPDDRDTGASPEVGQRTAGEGEPDFTRPALPPGQAELSLRELRALRAGRHRYTTAEVIAREMFGGGPERHYQVPTHNHPYYPVEAPGGRKVDVPVDLPDGRTLAVEIKHYLEFRTVKLADGTNQVVKGEVPLNKGIMEQINKDLTLRRMNPGYDPRWVFLDAPPSQALRNYLVQARIIFVEYGPAPK